MHIRLSVAVRGISWVLSVLGAVQLACVGGHIPPSTFQFENVVRYTGDGLETGGWKVAQVLVLLGKISPMFSAAATCDIEVGVPERNVKGWVLDEFAQVEAAKAADQAARSVLREQQPTALACQQFRVHMQSILRDLVYGPIPGATVTKFQRVIVSRRSFP
ncbi:hypothetical protein BO221_35615 [Archangium sp. Cb G35]|uniref:hypothetical protein n=1 Tax=Archangium sp. Cb G35 TaxID=1920190 RepID=UPI0009379F91|nr:hypothetical protein [Archangium sp. Cb G35]OJT19686.1 hypothetical protein BO221_35615 [Archangium sp. Cb G35]